MVTNSTYQSGPGDQSMSSLPKRKAGSKLTSGHLLMILSGLAAFLLIITLLGSQSKTITVYTAKENIFSGQKISVEDFEAQEIPSSSIDDQYFSADDFKDGKTYASRLISKGEPLLKQDKSPETEASDVRLISIPVAKKYAVNGTLAKGDKVDVMEIDSDGCSSRVLSGINVVSVSTGSSGGLGGGDSTYAVIVSLDNDVDDVVLAGAIGRGNNIQLVRTTGVNDSGSSDSGPQCEGATE